MPMNAPRILVVGSVNMDMSLPVPHLPCPGETVLSKGCFLCPGGKGANQAVAAARLGAAAAMAGCVGDDANGRTLLSHLGAEGVDTSFIRVRTQEGTGMAVIPVDEKGQNAILVVPGANGAVSGEDGSAALAARPWDAVLMQLEIPLETVFQTIAAAKAHGVLVVLDAGPAMRLPLRRLRGVDILSPNEGEALALTGIDASDDAGAVKAAAYLAENVPVPMVVLKLGARGALCYQDHTPVFLPAEPADVKDTTAAGDCFTAAMTLRMCEQPDLMAAVRYANQAAALCVSRSGAQPSLPTAAEITE